MDDERVDRLLRGQPREVASPGFTARVLVRLDEAEMARGARIFGLPRLTLPAVVLAATLAVAASLSLQGGGILPAPPARPPLASDAAHGRHGARAPLPAVRLVRMASAGRTRDLRATRHARALLQEIRTDHTRLHDEMRRRAAQSSKIYLGSDEEADLVVHLDQVRELPGRPDDPPPYQYD